MPACSALAWIIGDAVQYRQPDSDGCADCRPGRPCRDHDRDQRIADAMAVLLAEVRSAGSDSEALAAVEAFSPLVLAEIHHNAGAEPATLIAGLNPGNNNGPQISPAGRPDAPAVQR